MSEFKVGDSVKCLPNKNIKKLLWGRTGEIFCMYRFNNPNNLYLYTVGVYFKELKTREWFRPYWIEPAKKEFLIYRRQE
jgi:hypothetical protein